MMAVTIDHYRKLGIGDRCIVEHKGRHRVALVLGCRSEGRLDVRFHKTKGQGWLQETATVTHSDVVTITKCEALSTRLVGAA